MTHRTTVVLVGLADDSPLQRLPGLETHKAADAAAAKRRLEADDDALLLVGPHLGLEVAKDLLARCPATRALVVGRGAELAAFGEELIEGRLYYLSAGEPAAADLVNLLHAAARDGRAGRSARDGHTDEASLRSSASGSQDILELAERVAMQTSATAALELLAEELPALLGADRSQALLYDAAADTLWSGTEDRGATRVETAAVGLMSYVVRTGESLRLGSMAKDPRFEQDADDPEGDGQGALLAVPLLGSGGRPLAVLAAVRDVGSRPFASGELETLQLVASLASGTLERVLTETSSVRAASAPASPPTFRQQAADLHVGAQVPVAEPLQLSPLWTRRAFRALGVALAATLVLALSTPYRQTVRGEARIQIGPTGTTEVLAAFPEAAREHLALGREIELPGSGLGTTTVQIRDLDPPTDPDDWPEFAPGSAVYVRASSAPVSGSSAAGPGFLAGADRGEARLLLDDRPLLISWLPGSGPPPRGESP